MFSNVLNRERGERGGGGEGEGGREIGEGGGGERRDGEGVRNRS